MNHADAFELLGDYALGLLEPEEAHAVAEHMNGCEPCGDEARALGEAGEALSLSAEPVALPAGAEARIAAGVRARVAALSAPQAEALPPNVTPMRARESSGWRAMALGAAAGMLLLALGLTAVTIAWLDARADADDFEQKLAARAIELPLSGDGASGTIYVASDFSGGVARFTGLGPAPASHHYQVWSEGPGGAQAAADFTGSEGDLLVRLPELPKEMTRMFVTLEPDGSTASSPTGPEVLTTPR